MDDSNNSQFLAFDSPLNQSSYIKVIGVGGGGNNAVNHMFRRGITGVDFIVCNTDTKALNGSPVQIKLQLGQSGLGAGNDPAKARRAAEGKEQEIRELFEHNTKMVFITAGMGGGTGTGAAPVIARIAKEVKIADDDMDEEGRILVVAVVTTPFQFEGKLRLPSYACVRLSKESRNCASMLTRYWSLTTRSCAATATLSSLMPLLWPTMCC